jgi:hypothetical protein
MEQNYDTVRKSEAEVEMETGTYLGRRREQIWGLRQEGICDGDMIRYNDMDRDGDRDRYGDENRKREGDNKIQGRKQETEIRTDMGTIRNRRGRRQEERQEQWLGRDRAHRLC